MLGAIGFEKYKVRCIIGVEAKEREVEQDIFVDLQVEYDLSKALLTDSLEDTIDYIKLKDIVKDLAVSGRYFLLEKYAADVIKEVGRQFLVKSISICVGKPKALENAESCFVSIKVEL